MAQHKMSQHCVSEQKGVEFGALSCDIVNRSNGSRMNGYMPSHAPQQLDNRLRKAYEQKPGRRVSYAVQVRLPDQTTIWIDLALFYPAVSKVVSMSSGPCTFDNGRLRFLSCRSSSVVLGGFHVGTLECTLCFHVCFSTTSNTWPS